MALRSPVHFAWAARRTVLNASRALHRAAFGRTARDGSEIARFDATYLINDQRVGRRIAALIVHGPA